MSDHELGPKIGHDSRDNPVALFEVLDIGADFDHFTCGIFTENIRKVFDVKTSVLMMSVSSKTLLQRRPNLNFPIDWVDSHCLVANDNLVGGWFWYWSFADLERNSLLACDPRCLV